MTPFWKRPHGAHDLEAELRANRPGPRPELLASVSARVQGHRRRPTAGLRLAFAGGLSTVLLVGLASVGGMGYAGAAVRGAAQNLGWAPIKASAPDQTAAGDQYGHKVKVCHKGKTTTIDAHALPAHLRQGDKLGACPKERGKPAKRVTKAPKKVQAKAPKKVQAKKH